MLNFLEKSCIVILLALLADLSYLTYFLDMAIIVTDTVSVGGNVICHKLVSALALC
jgi:hypothetical protein